MATTALALSPHFSTINTALQGLKEVDCTKYDEGNDQKKKDDCKKCKDAVKQQKDSVPGKVKSAAAKDAALEKTAVANSATTAAAAKGNNRGAMNSDGGNKSGGSEAKKGQASNFANLAKELDSCKTEIETACSGIPEGDDPKKACEQAAAAAQQGAAESAAQAEQMAKDAQKDEGNGKGMEPPKMPEMPKQEPKEKQAEQPKSEVSKPEKVAGSDLSGNQLASKVGIGGADEKKAEDGKSTSFPSFGGRSTADSGISTSKDPFFGGANGGDGARNSSGSSTAGGLGGGAGGGEGAATAANPVTAAALAKNEDVEGYSNGSSRPSYLGMKSKGDLADLGLDAAANVPGANLDGLGAEGDRNLASTEQNSGIHTEDDGSSLFNMVRTRIKEIGRRGSI